MDNNLEKTLKTFKEIDELNIQDKLDYYSTLRNICKNLRLKRQTFPVITKIIALMAPLMRNFEIEIRGKDNLPKDDSAIFMCNHSNSHEFFIIQEVFRKLGRRVSPLASEDGLSFVAHELLKYGDVTFIKRNDRQSKDIGIMNFCHKILFGKDGFIFGEATWNLHPILPMQPVKAGGTEVALITGKVIVPTIFEYVEVPRICKKEKEIYSKVVVWFGTPYKVDYKNSIFDETGKIQSIMEDMRRTLWKELSIKRESLTDINQDIYLNHTYLKKFKALGVKYNSNEEIKYLLKKDGTCENEFTVDNNGRFVPSITLEK